MIEQPQIQMSSSLVVGKKDETFPVTEILTGRGFITGKSGSGKSNTASVVAEELLEQGLPVLIVDTDGEYYGLKAEFEMLQIGVGPDCDVELGPDRAGEIAELALGENVPVILDIAGYLEQSDAEELVNAVLKQLFALENQYKKPFLILVEELHEFVPQQQGLSDVGETIIRIAKRGRKRGLGICGMSQRPAGVDKDYITQCNWLVWHRLTWENDTRLVSQIMGADAAKTVQSLEDGEALVLTDWDDRTRRLQFRRKRTFDAGSTPSFSDADRPSLKTVDSALLERLQSTAGSEETESAASATESDSSTGETHSEASAQSTANESATTSGTSRDSQASSSGENGALWEFGQLVWYLLVGFASGLQSVVRWLSGSTTRLLSQGLESVSRKRMAPGDPRRIRGGKPERDSDVSIPLRWIILGVASLALVILVLLLL